MGHIVDEVILDLRIPLLTEDNEDGEDKGNQQYDGENHRRYHETYTREDVGVHVWEMNLHHSHLRRGVVVEDGSGEDSFPRHELLHLLECTFHEIGRASCRERVYSGV